MILFYCIDHHPHRNMDSLNEPKTSIETVMVFYPDTHLIFYGMEKRPIYDTSKNLYWPEAIDSNNNKIVWDDWQIRRTSNDGVVTTWIKRPSIQEVIDGICGNGLCIKFNKDGSIYMNYKDGVTWYYGPLIDGVYEDAYHTYGYDYEPLCERCRQFNDQCDCGKWKNW